MILESLFHNSNYSLTLYYFISFEFQSNGKISYESGTRAIYPEVYIEWNSWVISIVGMGAFYGFFVISSIISVIAKVTAAIRRLMIIGKLAAPAYEYVELVYTIFVVTCYCIMISIYLQ